MYAAVRGTLEPERQDRRKLESRLERIKELYDWGDYSKERYLSERALIQKQIAALTPSDTANRWLEPLAAFLRNVAEAWAQADQRLRKRLARRLYQAIWMHEKRVVAVKPQPECSPFVDLQVLSRPRWQKRKRRGSNPPSQP